MADSPSSPLTSASARPADPCPVNLDSGASQDLGHAKRIDHLFREHNDSLLRFLSARLGSYQDAQEVAQEAYVRLLSLDRPDAASFLKALLYKTASNLAIDRLRHRQHVKRYAHAATNVSELFESSADATLAALDDVRLIAQALEELPPLCRSAFLMSRVEALDAEEIAVRLMVSDRAVRKYIARALVFLQLRLHAAHAPRERSSPERTQG